MLATIDLDDKLRIEASEVRNELVDRMLTPKPPSFDLLPVQPIP